MSGFVRGARYDGRGVLFREWYRRRVDIVALVALATTVEEEAPRLAADLGSTPYETALLLRTPPPVPLLRTADRARALDVLAKLRARGHDAVACDEAAVATGEAMTHVRSFRFEADAFDVSTSTNTNDRARAPWSDIIALVRAMHRSSSQSVEKSTQRNFSLGRAALSGGVLLTKTTTKETKHTAEEREQVLYVFRRSGPPMLVGQSRALYTGLGGELRPSQVENFATLVRLLRERAPAAAYDERLLRPRPGLDRVQAGAGGAASASTSDAIDVLAHLVALALSRR